MLRSVVGMVPRMTPPDVIPSVGLNAPLLPAALEALAAAVADSAVAVADELILTAAVVADPGAALLDAVLIPLRPLFTAEVACLASAPLVAAALVLACGGATIEKMADMPTCVTSRRRGHAQLLAA